ncbi:aldose epimerase family protein [Limimaricola pyoseonensis]|uniref:Aldose 1-epimerase n=1 Tax=Limimaricola pyoseonensis TaxID=521013 RepID=A0A1G7I7Z2_9RHOB|nr:aldose epimerase family protein [Limimaricola pyoseonensis]SDF08698.1 aldose 1-epimerase [Limimaricola pyoseonensis]
MTPFGTTAEGRAVHRLTLAAGDLSVDLLTRGSILRAVRLEGVARNLTLGSDELADYDGAMRYFGAIVGPVANRLAGARATIDGAEYRFPANDGKALLHSGKHGTQFRLWEVTERSGDAATLVLDLPEGADGFPGNRRITARWRVTAPATLRLELEAVTDEPTLMNPVNHSYWNLAGTPDLSGHRLRVRAGHWLPTDDETLPTGEIAPTTGGAMDFRAPRDLVPGEPPLDHNFCLSRDDEALREVAELSGGGVRMRMATTAAGLQVYDGRDSDAAGLAPYAGLALEAQRWPDAARHPAFPSILLGPGETFRQTTEWRFAAD